MKKIISILFVLCSIFCVSCKKDQNGKKLDVDKGLIDIEENREPISLKNEEDENKKNIIRILQLQDVQGIMRYYSLDVAFSERLEEVETKELEVSDGIKEEMCNSFFRKYFSEDIEIIEKLNELPLSYQHFIYKKLKNGVDLENTLKILQSQDVQGIMRYYSVDVAFFERLEKVEIKKLEVSDGIKEEMCNSFFRKYFSEDIEIIEKLNELPLSYQYFIYKKLK